MKHLKIKLVVLALVGFFLLVLFAGSMPIMAESPNPAIPTVALPTPAAKPTSGAVSPAKVPTRALVAPTAPRAANPRVSTKTSGPAFTTYTSSINLQNLSSSAATIAVSYYDQNSGTSGGSFSDTIAANGSKAYFPIPGANTGFKGSAVISSNQPLGTIVNVVGGSFTALDSYVGQSGGNASVSLPLLMKNNSGLDTKFNVQNAGSVDATVSVAYSDGTTGGAPVTIKAGYAKEFSQASETHTSAVFSGVVSNSSTNQPLVVTVLEETTATMSAYVGFGSGSQLPVMPLVNIQPAYGIITGITIQNMGGSSTNVSVQYTPAPGAGNGTACTETQTIPNGKNKVFGFVAFGTGANSNCVAGSKFVGSGRVTVNSTSQPLAVIVNQALPGVNDGAYSGFNPNNATNKVVMPLIMDRNNGTFTSLSLMNVGANTTVNCTFTGTSYKAGTPINLSTGQGFTVLQNNQIANGYVGSGTCTATNAGDKIVAIVNQLGSAAGDQLLVYNAINQ